MGSTAHLSKMSIIEESDPKRVRLGFEPQVHIRVKKRVLGLVTYVSIFGVGPGIWEPVEVR